jgi:hypothetical protein
MPMNVPNSEPGFPKHKNIPIRINNDAIANLSISELAILRPSD